MKKIDVSCYLWLRLRLISLFSSFIFFFLSLAAHLYLHEIPKKSVNGEIMSWQETKKLRKSERKLSSKRRRRSIEILRSQIRWNRRQLLCLCHCEILVSKSQLLLLRKNSFFLLLLLFDSPRAHSTGIVKGIINCIVRWHLAFFMTVIFAVVVH